MNTTWIDGFIVGVAVSIFFFFSVVLAVLMGQSLDK